MKNRWEQDHEFNAPREVFTRALFLVWLAAFLAGILLTIAGTLARDLRLLAFGVGALALSGVAREWLHRRGGPESAEAGFNAMAEAGPALNPTQVPELVRLLRHWEALERRRGSPDFDPWAVQAVRHDIRAMVERDPQLERLFRV